MIGSLRPCGTAVHLLSVLRNLDRDQCEPWVICLCEPGPIGDAIREMGIEVDEYNLESIYSWRTYRAILRIAGKIRRKRIDIVQTYLFFDNVIGPVAARLGGARFVITGRRTVDDWESERHRRIYRLTNGLADRIVACSKEVEESVKRLEKVPAGKLTMIENAQSRETLLSRSSPEDDTVLQELRRKVGGDFVFGTVGNTRPQKRHDVLVRAFHRVAKKHKCHLVVVGSGPTLPDIEALASQLGVSERVHLVGRRANVGGFLETFSVFVLPSRAEGMSNALLEALLLGKACMATRFGLPQTEDGEEVVLPLETDDEEGLAETMERVLTDTDLRETLSARALALSKSISEDRMAREYEALYRELLHREAA